jgi:hypothetical protein
MRVIVADRRVSSQWGCVASEAEGADETPDAKDPCHVDDLPGPDRVEPFPAAAVGASDPGRDYGTAVGGPGEDRVARRRGVIPYNPQARKALELTFRQALRMGHNYIGTEHILLALLELEDGTGVLAGLGVDKATAEANITAAVAAAPADHEQK